MAGEAIFSLTPLDIASPKLKGWKLAEKGYHFYTAIKQHLLTYLPISQ